MNAIVTGATKGIGRAIAIQLAKNGFNLAINARNEGDLLEFKNALEKDNPNIEVLIKATDVSKKDEVHHFAEMVKAKWDTIDILVNNAGYFLPGQIGDEEEGTLESMINTNLYSAYNLTRAVWDLILANEKGHVYNICSTASFVPYTNGGSYCISKFALLGFSKVLREELKEKGIRVTSVMPGATHTPTWEGSGVDPERLMKAEDIADMVWAAYSLSDRTVLEEIVIRPQLGDL